MYTQCDLIVGMEVCHAEPAELLLQHLLLHHSVSQPLCFLSLGLSLWLSLSLPASRFTDQTPKYSSVRKSAVIKRVSVDFWTDLPGSSFKKSQCIHIFSPTEFFPLLCL